MAVTTINVPDRDILPRDRDILYMDDVVLLSCDALKHRERDEGIPSWNPDNVVDRASRQ